MIGVAEIVQLLLTVVSTLTVAAPVVNVPHSAGAAESSKASPRAGLNLQERIIGPGSKPRSLEVDGDDYRIRVGGIGRHILHRRNGAAYREGLRRSRAPGHAARRVDRAADRRAPYGAAGAARPRGGGRGLRNAVVEKVAARAAEHPALRAARMSAGTEVDGDGGGAFRALERYRAGASQGAGGGRIVSAERERRGRRYDTCLGDRGCDAQASGVRSGPCAAADTAGDHSAADQACEFEAFHDDALPLTRNSQ